MQRDIEKDILLRNQGWTVLHFWGKEIAGNIDDCIKTIEEAIFEKRIGEHDELSH